ncbi:MAG: NapC/NirT family cytochrome c [Ignavibacteriales bacterium]|nr:NapC/NirT family cytochrome c [Ignavibacteriales bacterium]
MKRKFPAVFYNPISLAGASIATVCAGLIAFLVVIEFFAREHKPYMGIVAFIILPAIMICGLILIAYGGYRDFRRKKVGIVRDMHFPVIDLNDPVKRRAVTVFTVGTIVLLVASAFGSFKAYEYTDSDEFCGTVCHSVMEPEYTAYQGSPHAKVGCVKCHIGSGADWFVRAKISGSYQLYSVAFNKFSRPIPTPVESLRPAQGTCEQCHSPSHFYGEKKLTIEHFLSDEKNSKSDMTILLKIGGHDIRGIASGIHWHVNPETEVWYFPADTQRQHIPYIKTISKKSGKESVYLEKGFPLDKVDFSKLRKMDCIDCHNRPSHIYHEPDKAINRLMQYGEIDSTLPYIKSLAVQVLEENYYSKKEALEKINLKVNDFYSNNYASLTSSKGTQIASAIKEIQAVYQRNYFPEMKVSWRKYPNNIGHTYYDGCFRCHDNKHQEKAGKIISADCNQCHLIIEQSSPETGKQVNLSGLTYVHPGELNNSIKNQKCSDCHGVKKY